MSTEDEDERAAKFETRAHLPGICPHPPGSSRVYLRALCDFSSEAERKSAQAGPASVHYHASLCVCVSTQVQVRSVIILKRAKQGGPRSLRAMDRSISGRQVLVWVQVVSRARLSISRTSSQMNALSLRGHACDIRLPLCRRRSPPHYHRHHHRTSAVRRKTGTPDVRWHEPARLHARIEDAPAR